MLSAIIEILFIIKHDVVEFAIGLVIRCVTDFREKQNYKTKND